MDRDLYNRQETLHLNLPKTVTVVGLGGTGSWVALFLALSGVEVLNLMDFDQLELSNFNRLPYPLSYIGMKKTDAAEKLILERRPDIIINKFGKATNFSLATTDGDWLFDCTDRQATQKMLFNWCKENNRKYVRDGYNGGGHITVSGHAAMWNTGEDQTGYEIVPSWVVPAALAGCLGVAKVCYYNPLDISLDIKDIRGK